MPRRANSSPQTQALLAALAASSQSWRHGFSLAKELGFKSGTLYPLLIRLADQGYLEAAWEPPQKPGVPPRHVYRITATGLQLARQGAEAERRSSVLPNKGLPST